MRTCYVILIHFLLRSFAESAKILFISPSITNSIVMFSGRIADVLVEAGHDVTFWIPEVVGENDINGTKLAKVVRTNNVSDVFERYVHSKYDFFTDPSVPIYGRFLFNQALCDYCEALIKRKADFDYLRDENFDLAFSDGTELCYVGLAHYLGIKQHIYISTGTLMDEVTWIGGIPQPPGYVTSFEDTLVGPVMSTWDRATNLYMYITGRIATDYHFYTQQRLFNTHVDANFPNLVELFRDSPLFFTAGDEFVSPAAPTLSKVISIAGVGIKKEAILDEDILRTVLRGRKGAIYFSLGTVTPTTHLNAEKRKALFDAFSSFVDFQFIVKISKDDELSEELTRHMPNIRVVQWAPQSELLAHPHVKLFISHGGYNSLFESAIRAKPMIIIPLFFDQFRNAKAVEYRDYGVILERSTITVKNVQRLIKEVLTNPKYQRNAQRLAQLFWSKPQRPESALIEWTKFVLDNGPLPELVPEGAKQNFIHYHCIDIYAFASFLLAVILYLAYRIVKQTCKIVIHLAVYCTHKKNKNE